jgi:hypothetical protein
MNHFLAGLDGRLSRGLGHESTRGSRRCGVHEDLKRIAALLAADGWKHVPAESEDGYTFYELGVVRLEVAFLVRAQDGRVYTLLVEGRAGSPTRRSRTTSRNCSAFGRES